MSYKKRLLINFLVAAALLVVLTLILYFVFKGVYKKTFVWNFISGLGTGGFLILMFAMMVFLSGEGTFNAFGFLFGKFFDLFRRDHERRTPRHYYEYCELKNLKPKPLSWPYMVVGFIGVAVSLIIYFATKKLF